MTRDEEDEEAMIGEPTFCFPDAPDKSADVHEPGLQYVRENGDGTSRHFCPNCGRVFDL